MKKRVLTYLVVMIATFSLQSCVSNYVVSNPITYKTDANLEPISEKSLNVVRTTLNTENTIDAALAKIEGLKILRNFYNILWVEK